MAPRLRCATRERRVRGRPAPGRAPPRPAGLNSMLVWRGWRRRRAFRGFRFLVSGGRRFACTGVTVAVLHSGNRLPELLYMSTAFSGNRRLLSERNIALFMRAQPGDVPRGRPVLPRDGGPASSNRAMSRIVAGPSRLQMNRAMFRWWVDHPSLLPVNRAMFLPVGVVLRRVDPARRCGATVRRQPGYRALWAGRLIGLPRDREGLTRWRHRKQLPCRVLDGCYTAGVRAWHGAGGVVHALSMVPIPFDPQRRGGQGVGNPTSALKRAMFAGA